MQPSGKVSNALRYTECYVRGPIAYATASSLDVANGAVGTLFSSAKSVTENNPAYTYSWTSVPPGFTSSLQDPTINPTYTATYIVTITDTNLGCSDTASVTVQVGLTGIRKKGMPGDDLVIYPNPTSGIVNIRGNTGEQVLEMTARNVYGETIMNISNSRTLDFSGFPNGIYYLTVRSGKTNILNYKIVKIDQ